MTEFEESFRKIMKATRLIDSLPGVFLSTTTRVYTILESFVPRTHFNSRDGIITEGNFGVGTYVSK